MPAGTDIRPDAFDGGVRDYEDRARRRRRTRLPGQTGVESVLEDILVEIGDTVKQGQPLAQLESSVEQAKVRLASLQAKSRSDVENRREQLRYAKQ
jgi:multidrug efflux pump subunit AcrA (membrane-fusion protein)